MTVEFSKGDKVEWDSHGSVAVGEVVRKITSDTEAAGRTVRASAGRPAVPRAQREERRRGSAQA